MSTPDLSELPGPVWGFDLSTVRVSVGWTEGARFEWDTVSLPSATTLQVRQRDATQAIAGWLSRLLDPWGRPTLVAYETPLAGSHTPLESFYLVGAWLAAVGHVLPRTELMPMPPSAWKKVATGRGYGQFDRSLTSAKKRLLEKQRLVDWAADACGYTGRLSDEADALGVTVAAAKRLLGRGEQFTA